MLNNGLGLMMNDHVSNFWQTREVFNWFRLSNFTCQSTPVRL